jgi:hypothetical protein
MREERHPPVEAEESTADADPTVEADEADPDAPGPGDSEGAKPDELTGERDEPGRPVGTPWDSRDEEAGEAGL